MSMRSFSPYNSPTGEAQRISLKTCRKQEKQKETGTKIFLQLWSGSHPGLCSVPAALCCQNLPESSRICQNLPESARIEGFPQENFSREHLNPPLALLLLQPNSRASPSVPWHCPVLRAFSKSRCLLGPWISG